MKVSVGDYFANVVMMHFSSARQRSRVEFAVPKQVGSIIKTPACAQEI